MSEEISLIEDISVEKYPAIYGRNGLDHFYEQALRSAVKARSRYEVDMLVAKALEGKP